MGKPKRTGKKKSTPKATAGEQTGGNRTDIRFRDISNVSGKVSITGGDSYSYESTSGLQGEDLKALFGQIYTAIDSRTDTPAGNKEDLKADVQEIESAVSSAVEKKEEVEEGFLLRRFRNIARMAPDLLDVIVATLANPLAGLGVAAGKLAAKAKEETGT